MNLHNNQIVMFSAPLPDENPEQKYMVIELKGDRADIMPLATGLRFPPLITVSISDLTDQILDNE